MGTRGYRVVRFRRRYYRFFSSLDSYREGLGQQIVDEIPTDPKDYDNWLAQRRREALGWETALRKHLCKKRADYEQVDAGADDGPADAAAADAAASDEESETEDDERNWGENLPGFMPVTNDVFIEWVYTIDLDLDLEVFTVNNSAHFRLNKSYFDCFNDISDDWSGRKVLVPALAPEGVSASLAVKPRHNLDMLEMYKMLDVTIVDAKGLHAFPPTQRHGVLLRLRIFELLQQIYEDELAITLLSWTPDHFPFREIAYAILCVASVSHNFSLESFKQVSQEGRAGYADVNDSFGKREFVAHLGVGCHLEGLPPGSSPVSRMYWFEGALVYLASQLLYSDNVVRDAVSSIVDYCRSQRPNQCVHAILMSIEHIVLMRLYPDGRVERTKPLTLIDIPMHMSEAAEKRYYPDELEAMRILKERSMKREEAEYREDRRQYRRSRILRGEEVEEQLEDDQDSDSDEEEDDFEDHAFEGLTNRPAENTSVGPEGTRKTFVALTHFLEVCARQQVPLSKPKEGIFRPRYTESSSPA